MRKSKTKIGKQKTSNHVNYSSRLHFIPIFILKLQWSK